MNALLVTCALVAFARAPNLEEDPPSRTVVTLSYLRTSYFYLDAASGGSATFGDPNPRDLGVAGESVYLSGLANRQIVGVSHGAKTEFSWNLNLQLSSDIEDWIVGLAGGLEWGGLAMRTEVSRSSGQLVPRRGVIVPPGSTEYSNRYVSFRLGWDARSTPKREQRVGAILGAGAVYQTSPQSLRIARRAIDSFEAYSPDNLPGEVIDPEWNSILAGFWGEISSLSALVGDDATGVGFASIVSTPGFELGISIDTAVLMGIGAGWPGPNADTWVSRITGIRYDPPSPQFVFFGMELDFQLGPAIVFEVAGQRFGLNAGVHGGGTVMLGLGGGELPENVANESSRGSSPVGVMRFHAGPFVELAARF